MSKLIKTSLKLTKYKPLVKKQIGLRKSAGRNNLGRITVRHQGGGVKRSYRLIDWSRKADSGIVTNLEYDPNRTSYIAKLTYMNSSENQDLKHSYILAPKGLKIFDKLQTILNDQTNFVLRVGDVSKLINFEVGDFVHCVEAVPGQGAIYARAAGTFCQVLQSSKVNYVKLKLPSGSQKLFPSTAKATLGILGREYLFQENLEKAGRNRWKNKRPTVRGVAMNPVDHPHGGGQGKTKGGRPSVSFKSRITKGQPTRSPRKKNILILSPRKSKKKNV